MNRSGGREAAVAVALALGAGIVACVGDSPAGSGGADAGDAGVGSPDTGADAIAPLDASPQADGAFLDADAGICPASSLLCATFEPDPIFQGFTQVLAFGGIVGPGTGFGQGRSLRSSLPAQSGPNVARAVLSTSFVVPPNAKSMRLRMLARTASRALPSQNVVQLARLAFGTDYITIFESSQALVLAYASSQDAGAQVSFDGPSFALSAWHELVLDIDLSPTPAFTLTVDGSPTVKRTDISIASTSSTALELGAATGFPCGDLDLEFDDVVVTASP